MGEAFVLLLGQRFLSWCDNPGLHLLIYISHIPVSVQDCLFSVPRCLFENGSEVFRDMYQLPTSDKSADEGSTAQNPLRLEGIEKKDFEQLLRVLLPL